MRLGTRSTAVKVLASVVLVGGAASVAGLGTFGAFTSTTSATEQVGSGKVVLTSAAGVQGLSVAATNMVPGDTAERSITLTRSSDTEAFGSVKLTTAGTASNLLTSDATNGLQLKVDECSVAWTKSASGALACSGTTTTVVTQRGVIGSNLDLGAATATLNGATATSNLRVTVSLPASADNTFQGLSNTINFTFDATQRAAKNV